MKKIVISLLVIVSAFLVICSSSSFKVNDDGSKPENRYSKSNGSFKIKNLNVYGEEACPTNENEICSGAKSAYLIEQSSGEIIYSKNQDQRLTIASMTKIMLLNLVFEAIENGDLTYDEEICISERASSMGGSQVFLQANKNYKVSDLIKSVIIASANDASVALSERLFGSEEQCVTVMNKKKEEWGMADTLFSNCTGLPKPTQYSSAKDVAKMLSKLITHKDYFNFSNIWLDELVHPDGQKTVLTNTNKLVKFYSGCDGGKTGFTSESKYCLAASAKRGDLRVVAVVIGEESSKERFSDVRSMFDYAFSNFVSKEILSVDTKLGESIAVKGGKKNLDIACETSYNSFMKKGENYDFTYKFYPFENLQAPIAKGQKVGEIIVYKDSVEVAKINAIAFNEVKRRNIFDSIKETVRGWNI